MNKNFVTKAFLFENGISISPEAKDKLDKISDIWLMDDYITCSGVTLKFEDQYATVSVDEKSKYKLIVRDGDFNLFVPGEGFLRVEVITPPDYMKDEIIIEGEPITVYVNTYTDRVSCNF